MLTLFLLANAFAADLHLDVSVDDWSKSIVNTAGEPYTGTFGPVAHGKKKIGFEITWPPSPHSVVDNGYLMEVTLCRVWAKGKKKGRDCVTENLVAMPEGTGGTQAMGEVKATDKWTFLLKAWATGDDIPSTEMPMASPDEPAD